MATFEVTSYGRFWVTAKVTHEKEASGVLSRRRVRLRFQTGDRPPAFGTDDAQRRMHSAWMISILLVTMNVAASSVMSGTIAV